MKNDFVIKMYVYEAKIAFNKIGTSCHEALDTPQKILNYMAGAFDDAPLRTLLRGVPEPEEPADLPASDFIGHGPFESGASA